MPDITFPQQLGMQAAGDVLGAGLGLMLGGIERKKQLEQQQKLQNMQIAGQKEMGLFNYDQQMKLWNDTNYAAQVAQIKKAGLSPGLIYGKGGGGGATTSIAPGNVSGAQARQGGESLGMALQMGQAAQTAANIALTKAQTQKTLAEIPNVPKTGANIDASTQSLLQGIESAKAQQALTEVDTALKSIQEHVAGATQNAQIANILENLKILENDREVSDQTKNDKIDLLRDQVKNIVQDTLLKQANEAKSWKEKTEIESKIKLIDQEYQMNTPDATMAKEGINPKAGTLMKWLYYLLKPAEQIGKAINK